MLEKVIIIAANLMLFIIMSVVTLYILKCTPKNKPLRKNGIHQVTASFASGCLLAAVTICYFF